MLDLLDFEGAWNVTKVLRCFRCSGVFVKFWRFKGVILVFWGSCDVTKILGILLRFWRSSGEFRVPWMCFRVLGLLLDFPFILPHSF